MNCPVISIVLPTFNGSRFLEPSVESCRQQTFTDWELIIVDDGSTDATPNLIKTLVARDPRIRSIRHQENRKLPAALNTGFSSAGGKYFTWTSDDNFYKPNALELMIAFLESRPDVDIVYSGYEVTGPAGNELKTVTAAHPVDLMGRNSVGPCFIYRRLVHEKLDGYDESLFLAEDYDFWLRASILFRMIPLHESLYVYREHHDSLSQKYLTGVDAAHRLALRRSLPHMSWIAPRARALGWFNLAALAWISKDWRDFSFCVRKAAQLSPFVTLLAFVKVVFFGRRINRTNLLRPPSWVCSYKRLFKV